MRIEFILLLIFISFKIVTVILVQLYEFLYQKDRIDFKIELAIIINALIMAFSFAGFFILYMYNRVFS